MANAMREEYIHMLQGFGNFRKEATGSDELP
jgi:hypothetical protein